MIVLNHNAAGWKILAAWCVLAAGGAAAQDSWSSYSYPGASADSFERSWGGGGWVGASGQSSSWDLGASGSNSDVGVIVRSVQPGSGAARAGINIGDVIVCVAGHQVGQVEGRLYDLNDEVLRRADPSGRVRLVMQEGRTQRLRPVDVQLAAARSGLSGSLVIRGGSVPYNSVVTVQLENVTRPHYMVRNGQYSFRLSSYSAQTIPFDLNYDPNYVLPQDRYRVRAYITANGRTIFDTAQPPYVLTQGAPNTVQLELTPARPTQYGDVVTAGYANYDAITDRVTTTYQKYLRRTPSTVELAVWQQMPDAEYRMQNLPLELMASQEFFDLTGNNNVVWLDRVFSEFLGRAPSPAERDQWMRRFAELRYSRMELLRQLQQVTRG